MNCRHCCRPKVNRPRGLCWSCYYAPGVRDLYPSTSKFARRGVGSKATGRMPSATGVFPGPEKAAVLEQRVQAGEEVWHPDDAVRSLE